MISADHATALSKPFLYNGLKGCCGALINWKAALASCRKVTPDEGGYLLRPKTDQQRKPKTVIFENWLRQQIGQITAI